ncbi:endo-1,4-beta-xylanase, partial [Actinomadura adrarensis]
RGDGHGRHPGKAPTTLQDAAERSGRVFGAAATQVHMEEADYVRTLNREFNQLTPENEMKWETTEPARGQFNFEPADQLVAHAKKERMKVHGHVLVWHSQLAPWVNEITDRDELLSVMRNHIANVAGHYRGKLHQWDVVNEAFDDSPQANRRATIFQNLIGDEYIAEAFKAARRADRKAELCYNDYNIDGINPKSDAVYAMVKDFKRRGVPIDCVGLQGHLILGSVPADIRQNIERFAKLGVNVYITELDIRMPTPPTPEKLAAQAADYRTVVSACVAVRRCKGITVWGVTDKYSWVPDFFPGEGAALIFDENYAKKPAYFSTLETLNKARRR